MSEKTNGNIEANNVFTNMLSVLNPSNDSWPTSLYLPEPFIAGYSSMGKLPNIFPEIPKKKSKEVTACPHSARKHYAKNMCNNCYHRLGRDKTAWACEHTERKHYAKGKCQFCYLKHYNRTKLSEQDIS